jgi:predicted RNA-binding protein with PUA-like domain
MRYWLFKSEPGSYSIDDLARDKTTLWEGVRNYQARNFMMNEMKIGDTVLYYHSSVEPPGVVGLATVSGLAEPDPTALDPKSHYYDPKSTKENPIWYCVRIKFKRKFKKQVSLTDLRQEKVLANMLLLRRAMRLSVQPVTQEEFEYICEMEKA